MSIISIEIMKLIHERETQSKKAKTEKNKGDKSCTERVRGHKFTSTLLYLYY